MLEQKTTTNEEFEALCAALLPKFNEYLMRHSKNIFSCELATSLDGIKTMPALYDLDGVQKQVIAPLALLTKDVDIEIEESKKATAAAKEAAGKANEAAASVTKATTDLTTERKKVEDAVSASKQQTADYQAIYDGLQAKSAEIDRLLASLQQQGSVAPMASIPASIATVEEVTVLAGATINVAPTDVQPLTANRSMIYQIYSGDALVDAAGNVKTSTAGDIIVKVIPTLASGAAKIVTIHVKEAEALTDESGNAITDENETEITC